MGEPATCGSRGSRPTPADGGPKSASFLVGVRLHYCQGPGEGDHVRRRGESRQPPTLAQLIHQELRGISSVAKSAASCLDLKKAGPYTSDAWWWCLAVAGGSDHVGKLEAFTVSDHGAGLIVVSPFSANSPAVAWSWDELRAVTWIDYIHPVTGGYLGELYDVTVHRAADVRPDGIRDHWEWLNRPERDEHVVFRLSQRDNPNADFGIAGEPLDPVASGWWLIASLLERAGLTTPVPSRAGGLFGLDETRDEFLLRARAHVAPNELCRSQSSPGNR